MKKLILILATWMGLSASALGSEILKDFDSLGGNADIYEKTSALNPEIKTQVIQNRIVNRRMRFELSPSVTSFWGGNPYMKTSTVGLDVNFHLTPRWSIGVAYNFHAMNELSGEGDRMIRIDSRVQDVDYLKQSVLAKVSYYPFYGKLNLFNNIVHFDIYTSLGGGTVMLRHGNQQALAADIGLAVWWSQHLTTRIGYQYMTYEAQLLNGPVRLDLSSAVLSVGYLL
ncbi:MAG: outer membrane beta-barrel domain-containing protein [Bdellovibrionaceae bacterium]|nr:outer membrane beta-barrel domain-containing protein [Pseudobdellovibrionaceae bacterium]